MMPLTELETYIQSELAKGVPSETIIMALTGAGWSTSDIEKAFSVITIPKKKKSILTRWKNPSADNISTSVAITLTGGFGTCLFGLAGSETIAFSFMGLVWILSILYAISGLIGAYRITPTRFRESAKRLTLLFVSMSLVGLHLLFMLSFILSFIRF